MNKPFILFYLSFKKIQIKKKQQITGITEKRELLLLFNVEKDWENLLESSFSQGPNKSQSVEKM
jgi:hypothetical protein